MDGRPRLRRAARTRPRAGTGFGPLDDGAESFLAPDLDDDGAAPDACRAFASRPGKRPRSNRPPLPRTRYFEPPELDDEPPTPSTRPPPIDTSSESRHSKHSSRHSAASFAAPADDDDDDDDDLSADMSGITGDDRLGNALTPRGDQTRELPSIASTEEVISRGRAPDSVDEPPAEVPVLTSTEVRRLKVAELKVALKDRRLDPCGSKVTLAARLEDCEAARRRDAAEALDGRAKRARTGGSISYVPNRDSDGAPTHYQTCPCCAAWLRGDVYACAAGHVACAACRATLIADRCPAPNCLEIMGSKRAYNVEKRLAEAVLPCAFADRGCGFRGPKADRLRHERRCANRTYPCPFSESCGCHLGADELRDHGVDKHRLRIVTKERGIPFREFMAEERDLQRRYKQSRRWKLFYAIDDDIYLVRADRRREVHQTEAYMSFGVYRAFRASSSDEADVPLKCQLAMSFEDDQGLAIKLNAEEALTDNRHRRQIPVDTLLAQRMQGAVSFPASLVKLAADDDPANRDLMMEVQVKFSEG